MINFIFDRIGPHGLVPNLVTRMDIMPKSQDWWDLAVTPPYSYEFRFLRYMDIEHMEYNIVSIDNCDWYDELYIYPIWLNFFDPDIDYFGLIRPETLQKVREGLVRIVFFYSEGDDPTLDIIDRLCDMCDEYDIDTVTDLKFVIANRSCKDVDPFVYFPDDEVYYRYLHVVNNTNYCKTVNPDKRNKKYTCLSRTDKPFRKLFTASLQQHGFLPDGYVSYNNEQYSTPSIEEPDETLNWNTYWNGSDEVYAQFELVLPLKCDKLSSQDHNNHSLIQPEYYQDAHWNFVLETHFDIGTKFLTEKTFKPILNLQPFLIAGPPLSLKLLKELGYKTFDGYIDESYDFEENNEKRLHYVFTEAYRIANAGHEGLQKLQEYIRPILEYNQQHFLSSKRNRLEDVIKEIQE